MLRVVMDVNGKKPVATLNIVRGDAHPKLPTTFEYLYQADYESMDGSKHRYMGKVIHNYKNGAFALVQRVTKAIVAQQKAAKGEN